MTAEAAVVPAPRGLPRAALAALRPRQWTKNLLLLAGIVFAAEIGDPVRWVQALVALAAYCAASSAAYLVNDVRDAPQDRLHPVKRFRPVARGELAPSAALRLAALLAAAALAVAAALGAASLLALVAFLALQLAYSTWLKHVVLVDVTGIAALFVLRAAAGALAVDVAISSWLLVCTALLALFLALGKRRAELALVQARGGSARRSLAGYDLALTDRLIAGVAFATLGAYTAYTLTAHDTRALVATVPLVAFGLLRYFFLLHRRDGGEEPEHVLLTDRPILVTVAVWAALAGAILLAAE